MGRRRGNVAGGGRGAVASAILATLLLSTLLLSTPVRAQTSSEAMAESLFVEARRLIEEGDYPAACPKLRQSHKLDPQLGTLLNLGKCYELNGQTASAWAAFTELSRLAARAGQKARADYAAERVEALEPELAYLIMELASPVPDGTTVTVDDEQLSLAVLGTALPLDPGSRTLTVQAPGHQPWRRNIKVRPGTRQTFEVSLQPEVVPDPVPPPLPPVPPPLPPPLPPVVAPEPTGMSSWWIAAVVGYTVAGAGAVVGGVTGGLALDEGGSLSCPMDACAPADADALSRANTLANVSNVSFAVAGAGALLGIVATVVAASDDRVEASWGGATIHF